ncbi:MAG: alpha-mannosidase [bacterium]|jgi:alpha-mannosidase|nr:alpha-mannosidase [candidate division KSB1 bacterium]MDH7560592.1 alpha-mannosidase [bacterium]
MVKRLPAVSLAIAVLAATAAAQSQDTFVREWLVVGAFAVDPEHEPLRADHLGGEVDAMPRLGQVAGGKSCFVAQTDQQGRLNFIRMGVEPPERSVVYAHVYVFVPRLVEAVLLVGSDDGVLVRVNGNAVHEHLVLRGWRADQDTVREQLGAGWNRVLCKVFNNLGGFSLSLRVTGPQGEAIEGLRYAAELPADYRPAVVPSRYDLASLSVAPHAQLTAKGSLMATVQAQVRPHGTTPVAALRCVLQVASKLHPLRRTEGLRGDPFTIAWAVPLSEVLRAATAGDLLTVAVDWGRGKAMMELSLTRQEALGAVLAGVELSELFSFSQTTSGTHGKARLRLPKELAAHELCLRVRAPQSVVRAFCDDQALPPLPQRQGLWQAQVRQPEARFALPRLDSTRQVRLAIDLVPAKQAPRVFIDFVALDYAALLDDLRFGEMYAPGSDFGQAELWTRPVEAFQAADAGGLRAALQEFRERSEPLRRAMKQDTIHVVGNAHIDMAWLWRWQETVQVCEQTFRQALEFMGKDSTFTYAQSQAQAYQWMECFHPEILAGIKEMVRRGQWLVVGGMWVEPDCNLPAGEALVRQILLGKQYLREKLGVDPRVGWTPDTFGYAWTLPQIYKKSGIDYFVTSKLWWNDTTPPEHQLFWWESPDGSRILTVVPLSYVEELGEERTLRTLLDFRQATGVNHALVLYGVGDHGGGPTKEMLARFDHMAETRLYPTVVKSSAEAFFRATETKLDLPIVRNELYLQTHRGTYTTQGAIKKRNRQMEVLLETAEKFASFAPLPYPEQELRRAWQGTLFNQFHDILPGSSIPEVYKDAHALYDSCQALAGSALQAALEALCAEIDTRGKGMPVVVFNPLSWDRSDVAWVRLPGPLLEQSYEVVDANGVLHAAQLHEDGLLFEVSGVPGVGYKVFWLRPAARRFWPDAPQAVPWTVQNGAWEVKLNAETGDIASVVDRTSGREVLAGPGNQLQFFEDQPAEYDAWNIGYTGKEWRADRPTELEVIAQGPVRATLRVVRPFGSSRFVQDITLYRRLPRIDISTRADWHESHVLAKAAFPVAVQARAATYEIPYGWIQRTTVPATPAEKAMFEVPAQKWVDLTDDSSLHGVSLLNDCKYGHDICGNVMRITLLRSPKNPDPNADMGEHEFTYSLLPHAGNWQEAESHRRAFELNYPLQVLLTQPHPGRLGKQGSFVLLDAGSGVMLSAVKRAEKGEATVLRVYELFGKETSVQVTFRERVAEAFETNLLEAIGGSVPAARRTISTKLAPFEIKTLLVRFASQAGPRR